MGLLYCDDGNTDMLMDWTVILTRDLWAGSEFGVTFSQGLLAPLCVEL